MSISCYRFDNSFSDPSGLAVYILKDFVDALLNSGETTRNIEYIGHVPPKVHGNISEFSIILPPRFYTKEIMKRVRLLLKEIQKNPGAIAIFVTDELNSVDRILTELGKTDPNHLPNKIVFSTNFDRFDKLTTNLPKEVVKKLMHLQHSYVPTKYMWVADPHRIGYVGYVGCWNPRRVTVLKNYPKVVKMGPGWKSLENSYKDYMTPFYQLQNLYKSCRWQLHCTDSWVKHYGVRQSRIAESLASGIPLLFDEGFFKSDYRNPDLLEKLKPWKVTNQEDVNEWVSRGEQAAVDAYELQRVIMEEQRYFYFGLPDMKGLKEWVNESP